MKPLVLLVSAAVLAIGGMAWYVHHAHEQDRMDGEALEPDATPGGVREMDGGLLADPDARVLEDERDEGAGDPRVALGLVSKPAVAADPVKRGMPASVLTGRVVDERTGLPLPRYMVRIEDEAGRRLDTLTDDDGAFASSEPVAIGTVRLTPFDHAERHRPLPAMVMQHAQVDERPPLLQVETGPTYHVSFGPANGPDPGTIELRLRGANDDDRTWTDLDPLRAAPPYAQPGEGFWVRFPALDPAYARAEAIEARSRDGVWIAQVPATVMSGSAPGVVHIELEARAAAIGVVMESGAPVAEALVTLRSIKKAEGDQPFERSTRTGQDGRYRFDFLKPCEATLRVSSIRHAAFKTQIVLRSNEVTTTDALLTLLPTVGRVRGRVVSDSGTYEPDARFTLVRDGDNGRDVARLQTKVAWETHDGVREGRFDFGLLPKGKYRIDVEEDDWFEWKPRRTVCTAPKEDIVVRVADVVVVSDIAFDVHDSDNGLPLNGFHLQLETFDGERALWSDSGAVVFERYPEDKRLRWRLDKPGYPSQIGDLSSFVVRTVVDGRARRTCEINVQPGWSDFVRVTRRNSDTPLAGVAVSVDGRPAGKTNSDGVLRIVAREKPASVTLALENWRSVGRIDLQSPAKRNYRRYIPAQMQPVQKKK